MKRRVTFVTSSRSEKHLTQPVVDESLKRGIEVSWLKINPNHDVATISALTIRKLKSFRPDIVWVGYDRREVVPVAVTTFYEGLPIFHYGGGSFGSGIWDETSRFVLSRLAHYHYCITRRDARILRETGEEGCRISVVGTTAFDKLTIDESLCPPFPFDLVLLNPDPQSEENTRNWARKALRLRKRYTVVIEPNEDANREIVVEELKGFDVHLNSVPHGQFLGLLKNCVRAIGNSSSFVYELPYFDARKWVPIGDRNKGRTGWEGGVITGASAKMAEHLAKVEITPELLLKRYAFAKSRRN